MLGLRLLQGVALAGLPAIATAYLREELHPIAQARAAGLYIGGTALGGMVGRLLTAPIADAHGWRWAMAAAALFALVCAVAVTVALPPSQHFRRRAPGRLGLATMSRAALADPALRALYLLGACAAGALVAVYNALGFRLTGGPHHLALGTLSLVYLVYVLGTMSSVVSGRLADRFGRRAILPSGCVLAIAGVLLTGAALVARHRDRPRRADRRVLRRPRARQRLGGRACPPRRRQREPGRGVLPVRLLRRILGLRQPGEQRVGRGRMAGCHQSGAAPVDGHRLAGPDATANPGPRPCPLGNGESMTSQPAMPLSSLLTAPNDRRRPTS